MTKPERPGRPGGIDTGINPLGTDSDGRTYRNPKASYQVAAEAREVAARPGPAAEGLPGLVGGPEEDRRLPPAHPGLKAQRPAPDDQRR